MEAKGTDRDRGLTLGMSGVQVFRLDGKVYDGYVFNTIAAVVKRQWRYEFHQRSTGDTIQGLLARADPSVIKACINQLSRKRGGYSKDSIRNIIKKMIPSHMLTLGECKFLARMIRLEFEVLRKRHIPHLLKGKVITSLPYTENTKVLKGAYPTFVKFVTEKFLFWILQTFVNEYEMDRVNLLKVISRPHSVTCPVCLEETVQFNAPRGWYYNAGCVKHTMCHDCFMDLVKKSTEMGTQPKCPSCRLPIYSDVSRLMNMPLSEHDTGSAEVSA